MLHPSTLEVLSTGVKPTLLAADGVLCDLGVFDALVPLDVEVDAMVPLVVEVTVSTEASPGDSTC